ncbi:MAG: hypothetical protein AAFZ15_20050 [Bacteroidota bacterium]
MLNNPLIAIGENIRREYASWLVDEVEKSMETYFALATDVHRLGEEFMPELFAGGRTNEMLSVLTDGFLPNDLLPQGLVMGELHDERSFGSVSFKESPKFDLSASRPSNRLGILEKENAHQQGNTERLGPVNSERHSFEKEDSSLYKIPKTEWSTPSEIKEKDIPEVSGTELLEPTAIDQKHQVQKDDTFHENLNSGPLSSELSTGHEESIAGNNSSSIRRGTVSPAFDQENQSDQFSNDVREENGSNLPFGVADDGIGNNESIDGITRKSLDGHGFKPVKKLNDFARLFKSDRSAIETNTTKPQKEKSESGQPRELISDHEVTSEPSEPLPWTDRSVAPQRKIDDQEITNAVKIEKLKPMEPENEHPDLDEIMDELTQRLTKEYRRFYG